MNVIPGSTVFLGVKDTPPEPRPSKKPMEEQLRQGGSQSPMAPSPREAPCISGLHWSFQ